MLKVEDFVEQHWDVAVTVARIRAAQTPQTDPDDVLSDAALGLLRAAQTWNERSGRSQASWARYKIERAITDGIRNRTGRVGSARANTSTVALLDHDKAIPDRSGPVIDRVTVLAAIGDLTERQRLLVFLRYYDDLDLAEIGRRFGVTPSSVHHWLKAAHARLRETLQS